MELTAFASIPGVHRCRRLVSLGSLFAIGALVGLLAPRAGAAQLTLSWADNSTNEDGFRIERGLNSSTFSEVATVGPNVTQYTDSSVSGSTTYWYRVRAYNSAGSSAYTNVASATAAAPNQAPTISNIADRTINQGTSTGAIAFTIGDAETAAGSLTLTRSSSNTTLVPTSGIVLGGSGANRTVTVTPASSQSGVATITVSVSDGAATTSDTFVLTVTAVAQSSPPVITAQPTSATVSEGAPASFTVAATGAPAPTYQWRRNGTNISGATSATYSISSAQASHAGTYTVVVSNSHGSVTSTGAGLTVTAAFAVTTQPASQSIASGANATLTVGASGTGLAYQWFVGASGDTSGPIAGATSASFTTPALSGTTSYWVRVTSGAQTINSSTALVTVTPATRFFFGNFGSPTAGEFGLMVRADNTGVLLGAPLGAESGVNIQNLALNGASFSVSTPDLGVITGQISGANVTGQINALGLSFNGAQDSLTGATAALAGRYDGAIVNTSSGQVIVLAGTNGRAFVFTGDEESYTGVVGTLAADGSLVATLPDGRALALDLALGTGYLEGVLSAGGQSYEISGRRSDLSPSTRLINASMRGRVQQGAGIMIAGFAIEGSGSKRVLVRGVGPALAPLGVSGVLTDPLMAVHRVGAPVGAPPVAENDDWAASAMASQIRTVGQALGAFTLPDDSKESALLLDLTSGVYTAHVSGVSGSTGAALVELYDGDDASAIARTTNLVNISMRADVSVGDGTLIAGFVVAGQEAKRVLLRVVGPELSQYQVPGVVPDPQLIVYQRISGADTVIAVNDDWGTDAVNVAAVSSQVGAFALQSGSKSAAAVLWLAPGIYTVHATPANGAAGVALMEVYAVP